MWLCQSASHRPPAFLALEHGVHLGIRHKPTGANHKVADEHADKGLRRQVLDWVPRRGLNWFVTMFDYPVRECLKGKKNSLRLILSQNTSTRMLVNLLVDFLKVNNFFPGWLCHFNLKTSSLARSLGDLMHWSSLRSLLATYERLTCSKSNFLVEQCTVDSPLKVICMMKSFHGTITSRNLQCFTFLSM